MFLNLVIVILLYKICNGITPSSIQLFKPNLQRDIEFWKRTIRIYSSYKNFQLKIYFQGVHDKFRKRNESDHEIEWNQLHEINSKRMIDMCLSLRGFYLKAGQFLGTRHDFMPNQYTSKLSQLHDDVPSMKESIIENILQNEFHGKLYDYFSSINLKYPVGSASIGQVHEAFLKSTNEKVAVKIKYPFIENLITKDLNNLEKISLFLTKYELKFDLYSCVKELQSRIKNEFDYGLEFAHLSFMNQKLLPKFANYIEIPRPIYHTNNVLVMSFIEGINLSKFIQTRNNNLNSNSLFGSFIQRKFLDIIAKTWGYQIFILKVFNGDCHPGNLCINFKNKKVGLLDWGQVIHLSNSTVYMFAQLNEAINNNNIIQMGNCFDKLGIVVENPSNLLSIRKLTLSLFDTQIIPGYDMNPFKPTNELKSNAIKSFPSDLYFLVRTIQLIRGIAYVCKIDYSLAKTWQPYAKQVLQSKYY